MSLVLAESFPHCNAKCDKLQSLGRGLGRWKTTAASPNAVGYQDWGASFCQRNIVLSAKCHLCPHHQPKRRREWHLEWGSSTTVPHFPPRLVLGATPASFWVLMAFLCLERSCFPWFWGEFPTWHQQAWNMEQPWFNSSGKCSFRGRRWRFLKWKSFPVSYLTIHKDFWFLLNSTLLTLPKATLSPGHTPQRAVAVWKPQALPQQLCFFTVALQTFAVYHS